MALKSTLFKMLPWVGGVNTSVDESQIDPNQLTQADNVLFGVRGSRQIRPGLTQNWDSGVTGTASIIGQKDFWFGQSTRTQVRLAVHDDKKIHSYTTSGTKSANLFAGTAWASSITSASLLAFNNLCLIAVDGASNVMKKWTGSGNVSDLGVYTTTGNTATTITVTNLASMTGIVIGAAVTGSGIQANTVVASVTPATSTITLSLAATSSLTGVSLTFTITPPACSIMCEHQGRVWTNDKTNLDRINCSQIGNAEIWGGLGDSGGFDIGIGDGDPDGVTGMFSFKNVLFVGKRNRLYKITGGPALEDYSVELISRGIGITSHNSIDYIDLDDVFFCSERGVHSIGAVLQYGDFNATYVSKDIQQTFNNNFPKNRRKYIHGAYLSNINTYAIAVTDNTYGSSANNAVWGYNIEQKIWYRLYANIPCASLIVARDSDQDRFYLGGTNSRIYKTFTGVKYDVDSTGANTSIPMRVASGIIYVDDNAFTMKKFIQLALFYKPTGNHTITVTLQVDNYSPQSYAFTQATGSDLLGSTFILGSSLLAGAPVLAPYTLPIEGIGRGIKVTIEQNGVLDQADVEIQGFGLIWEPAETRQEVVLSN